MRGLRGVSAMAVALVLAGGFAGPVRAAQAAALGYTAPSPAAQAGWRAQSGDYYWIDTADGLLEAIGDAPPDFTFRYRGDDAWGWELQTGHLVLGETDRDGGMLYYYFEPEADAPFLVQEAGRSFAYQRQRLVVVYNSDGAALSPRDSDLWDDRAGDLYERGIALREAADGTDQWDAVDAGWWAGQVATVIEWRLRWESGRVRHPGWQRWRGTSGAVRWR
uniref:hypothetical protein n=1 Tax=Sphingomonas sp. CCH9-H8 TaxID=1768772 RepID=UPI000B0A5073